MIAVDTSALMAILLGEPEAERCIEALTQDADVLLSAGTAAEALIVAARRNLQREMTELIEGLGFRIVPVTKTIAERIADGYARWGKGIHPAALNFGDCFAYAIAKAHACPLLFVGSDFAKTDLQGAL